MCVINVVNVRCAGNSDGFTLVELVVTLSLLGILSAMALPRFIGTDPFTERAFHDESLAALGYARQLAYTSGCDVRVEFSNSGYRLGQWSECTPSDHSTADTPVPRPGGGDFTAEAPTGVTVSNLVFFFDQLGRPREAVALAPAPLISASTELTLTIGGRTVQVEPDSGFAHTL